MKADDEQVRGLRERIAADPSNDEPRHVLADLLMERGDPRGEFIQLQLAQAAGDRSERTKGRLKILLGRHGRQWLPPGVREDSTFERGFLHTALLDRATDPTHVEWGSVVSLEVHPRVPGPLPFERRRLMAVKRVATLDDARLRALLGQLPPSLESVGWLVDDERFAPGFEAELVELRRRVPTLKELAVVTNAFPFDDVLNPVVESIVRIVGPQLGTLRVPARDLRVLLLQRTMREVARQLRLQLVFSETAAGAVWIEIGLSRIFIGVRAEPGSAIVDTARRVMHRAGYGLAEIHAVDRNDVFTVETNV